ncbi:hypothetical protein E2C01_019128 [Portunus trituberculatus]|uniref:Uncharacterized protein n=1 Tax=Portunus trituberculatus TaxID=210409 RepID=A0A5B7DWG2_PORTR|nr:hypothetical protein [Portunus trituberculatus]
MLCTRGRAVMDIRQEVISEFKGRVSSWCLNGRLVYCVMGFVFSFFFLTFFF